MSKPEEITITITDHGNEEINAMDFLMTAFDVQGVTPEGRVRVLQWAVSRVRCFVSLLSSAGRKILKSDPLPSSL